MSSPAIAVLALGLGLLPTLAVGGETSCPEMHEGARLTTVTVFDGPPSEQASLVPDTDEESRAEWDVAYIFKAGRRLFVECQYGRKGPTVVIEPEPSTYRCAFRSDKGKGASLVCYSH